MNYPEDDKEIILGGDSDLEIWNWKSGKMIRVVKLLAPHHSDPCFFARFIDHETIVAGVLGEQSGGSVSSIVEFNINKEIKINDIDVGGEGSIMDIQYVRRLPKSLIMTSSWKPGKKCTVFTYPDYKKIAEIEHNHHVNSSTYSHNTNEIYSTSQDRMTHQYSLERSKILNSFKSENYIGNHITYLKDRRMIATLYSSKLYLFKENEFPKISSKYNLDKEKENIDLYCCRFHHDGNLLSVCGMNITGIYDLRKPSKRVFGERIFTFGEVWRQQLIGKDKICYGISKQIEVMDWNWKSHSNWTTKHSFTDCLAYRGDQLNENCLGKDVMQSLEDEKERILYVLENTKDEYEHIRLSISGNTFCVILILVNFKYESVI